MTTRMLLVGLVAALGVTIPTPYQCSQWWLCVQNVGSAALADWDHGKPDNHQELRGILRLPPAIARKQPVRESVRPDETRTALSVCGSVESQAAGGPRKAVGQRNLTQPRTAARREGAKSWANLPADVFQTPTIVFEPLVISGDPDAGVAYELNRMSDGIGIKEPANLGSKKHSAPSTPSVASVRLAGTSERELSSGTIAFAACSRIDNLDVGLWAGLFQSAERAMAEDQVSAFPTPTPTRFSSDIKTARRNPEAVLKPAHPLTSRNVSAEPEIASDFKHAILLTKDALNAWMGLVRRGSSLTITKR